MIRLTNEQEVFLSLGEWHVTDDPEAVLVCLGLGSCVAISLYDPSAKVAAMAHMVLPDSTAGRASPGSAKFVDQAMPMLIEELREAGANKNRLVAMITGGACMLTSTFKDGPEQVGPRNVVATKKALAEAGITIKEEETGGSHGRTVRFYVGTGEVQISTAGSSVVREFARAA
ncbi:MAG: chemotaxis protein CheD [Dehalococcoidia bacterium]